MVLDSGSRVRVQSLGFRGYMGFRLRGSGLKI